MRKLLLLSLLILTSCSTKEVFVVLRDVPEKPTFTVIPANYVYNEVQFANRVEKCLIGARVKVVSHPGTKEIQTEEGKAKGKSTSEPAFEASGKVIVERYRQREPTDADYIVETYAVSRQVKIIRNNQTHEILAVLTAPVENPRLGGPPGYTLQGYVIRVLTHLEILRVTN